MHISAVQNAESLITLTNNRQDAGNVPLFGISAQNSTTDVAKISFYRGSGGASGYLTFSTKADNTSSLTEKVRIDGGGNVGIGTTSPGAKLDVSGVIAGNSTLNLFYTSSRPILGNTSNLLWVREIDDDPTLAGIDFQNYSGASLMRIKHGGNVGIGTTNPVGKLTAAHSCFGYNTGSMTDGSTQNLTTVLPATFGFLFIMADSGISNGIFMLEGGVHVSVIVADPNGSLAASDTGGKLCVYWSAGDSAYLLKNNLGDTRIFSISLISYES